MSDGHSAVAQCPICNQSVPMDTINSHIDICLLPGGQSIPSDKAKTDKLHRKNDSTLFGSHSRKRLSPSSSSSSSSGSKENVESSRQSVLPFVKASSLLSASASVSDSPPAPSISDPPPAKIRKNGNTPTSHFVKSSPRNLLATSALTVPLAESMRPSSMEHYVGQEKVVGGSAVLRGILETGQVPSLIFWGPPGCGKTTLARIIATLAKDKCGCRFVQLSATTSGVNEIKEVVKVAKNEKAFKRRTILFIDEIHRFNKLQQDTFLPHVEDGTITLLGATTENPSFQLNSALLSRCCVIVLEKLGAEDVTVVLRRAANQLGVGVDTQDSDSNHTLQVEEEALTTLAEMCDGDARCALNGLQLAIQTKQALLSKPKPSAENTLKKFPTPKPQLSNSTDNPNSCTSSSKLSESGDTESSITKKATITVQDVKESLQRSHLLYDRAGDEHYNIISALHKSMRGGDGNASLYWLARMLCAGEDPLYVARRVVRFASEDIGLADPNALTQAVAAFQGCHFLGMPECEVLLAQAVVYMAQAPKSIQVYSAYNCAKKCVHEHKGPLPSVPLHLRNAPTSLMKSLGYGRDYKYNPDYEGGSVEQDYMPEGMQGLNFLSN